MTTDKQAAPAAHTVGRLYTLEKHGVAYLLKYKLGERASVTSMQDLAASDMSPADARRLAACWNAFLDLSTEDIEAMGGLVMFKGKPMGELVALRTERDLLHTEVGRLTDVLLVEQLQLVDAKSILREMYEEGDLSPLRYEQVGRLLGDQPELAPRSDAALALIASQAQHVVNRAAYLAVVLTVTQHPLLPLAMGNYETVVQVRVARERAQ